ncbi:MAG: hypothetical protein ABIP20_09485 [Chthoniobacteraceae bacterium]
MLVVLAGVCFATGDARAGTVMALMVLLGVTQRFVQESRADAAAAKPPRWCARGRRKKLRSSS